MLAISLSLLFPKQKWGIGFGWAWALLIGYSRMDLGVHYPSDIIGSIIISGMIAFAFITLMIHFGFWCETRYKKRNKIFPQLKNTWR